ncbi:NAD-dependent protein deacetylase [bacterium]|nr:NAD-dependent protein deacetylase [bacterium]
MLTDTIKRAAEYIIRADALLIMAGAGMGVDSGLPDFRGKHGFWQAYPPYASRNLSFVDLANPSWFQSEPALAWGFYGHRLNLYRETRPHQGFFILKDWATSRPGGYFVFTSNVDGQFQKAGFLEESIEEVHGSIHYLQCTRDCGIGIFATPDQIINIDETTMTAHTPLPSCPACGALARPNILMFNDWEYDNRRRNEQTKRFEAWLDRLEHSSLVIIESGAGRAVPTVRMVSEQLVRQRQAVLIRINVREPEVPANQISFNQSALDILTLINNEINL